MKKLISLISILFLASSVHAYDGNPSDQVSKFFKDIGLGKHSEAIEQLFSNQPLMRPKKLVLLTQDLSTISTLYGAFISNENMKTEQLSPSVFRIVEVAKYENHPVIWEFYFYKPKDKWIVSQGRFFDRFENVGTMK